MKKSFFACLSVLAVSGVLLAQNSQQVQSDLNFGMELYKNKMYDLAGEQFTKFLQEYPTASSAGQARYYLALSQQHLKEFADAAKNFQAFAVQYPNDPSAPDGWIQAGECFAEVKDYSNAALSFERLQVFYTKDPRAPGALIRSAMYFEMAGDTTRAENSLVNVVENYSSSPGYFTAMLELGDLYLVHGQLDKAENQYKALISSGNDSVRVKGMVALGRLDRMRGQSRRAERYFDDAAQLNIMPQSLDALLESIELDQDAGNFSLAKQRAGEIDATTLTPGQKEKLDFVMAYSQVGEGNLDSVRDEMDGLASLPAPYRLKLARLFNSKGDFTDGLAMLRNIPPADASPDVLELYAELAFNAGDVGIADSVLVQSVQRANPPSGKSVVRLLTVEDEYLHDPTGMRETFYKYESVLKQMPDAYLYYKARVDGGSRDYSGAIEVFQQLLRDYPESNYAGVADSVSTYLTDFKSIDYRKAIGSIADILLEQSTDREGALLHLGNLYGSALKDYGKAADVYRRLATVATGDTQRIAEYLLAGSLDRMEDGSVGENTRSYSIYQKLASDSSNDSIAERSLARVIELQAESGDSLAAENSALNFLTRFPNSALASKVYMTLARVLFNTGAYRQAIAQAQLSGNSPQAALLISRSQIALSLVPDADSTIQKLISSDPPKKQLLDAQLLYTKILRMLNQDPGSEYLAILNELVPSTYKDSVETRFGDYLYSLGLYDSAYTIYASIGTEALWNRVPTSALYKMAYCRLKAGKIQQAKELFSEVLTRSKDPNEIADSYLQLGNIYNSLGDRQMSASFFEKAGTNNLDAMVNAANTYFKVKDYQDAAQVYKKILASAPSDTMQAFASAKLIEIDYETNDIVTADAAAAKFQKDYPNAPRAYPAAFLISEAKYLIQNKKYNEAQRLLDRVKSAYKNTPSYTSALLQEARIEIGIGEIEKAQARLADLLKKYPNCADAPEAHLELGNIYFAKQKYQVAVNELRTVYADSADVDRQVLRDAMARLITSYESAGQYAGALDVDRRFIEMFPDDPTIMDKKIQVGILYEELQYFDQALTTFQALTKQAGAQHQAELHYYIGAIYNDMGNYQMAILEFLKVPYLTKGNPVIDWAAQAYYMAGKCYEKLNKPNDAIAMYEKIVHKPNTDPNYIAGAEREIKRVQALLK